MIAGAVGARDLHPDPARGRVPDRRRAPRRRARIPRPHLLRARVRRARRCRCAIVQSSTIHSPRRHTLRGLHYQEAPHAEIKLVRCTRGSIFLVMVDLRPDSPTRNEWLGVELSARQPSGSPMSPRDSRRATRRSRTTPRSSTRCRTTTCRRPPAECAGTTRLGIEWPAAEERIISERDRAWPDLAGLSVMASRQIPVSIICVFNDPDVRRRCLDRSIEEHRGRGPGRVPADRQCRRLVCERRGRPEPRCIAGQPATISPSCTRTCICTPSVRWRQLRACSRMTSASVSSARSVSRAAGEIVGRVRDRVLLLGEPLGEPTDVDSLDEVLFMVPRHLVRREPLSEAPELAWHAYAVEYGLRARSLGLRVCAVDIPLTHHSLTRERSTLDVAYGAIAARYPDALPVRAPGGLSAAFRGGVATPAARPTDGATAGCGTRSPPMRRAGLPAAAPAC